VQCPLQVARSHLGSHCVYTLRYNGRVPAGIEFDWDRENRSHIAAHRVTVAEVMQLFKNGPIDLDYALVHDEERYRSVGMTNSGRLLTVAWTIRRGKIRAITAFPAGIEDKRTFIERQNNEQET